MDYYYERVWRDITIMMLHLGLTAPTRCGWRIAEAFGMFCFAAPYSKQALLGTNRRCGSCGRDICVHKNGGRRDCRRRVLSSSWFYQRHDGHDRFRRAPTTCWRWFGLFSDWFLQNLGMIWLMADPPPCGVRYKEIKRGLAKPIEDYLGRTHLWGIFFKLIDQNKSS